VKANTPREPVERYENLPRVDHACMTAEADEFFGTEDRLGDDDLETPEPR
jgi:hypothetical protein